MIQCVKGDIQLLLFPDKRHKAAKEVIVGWYIGLH